MIGDVVDPRCSLPGGTKGVQLLADGIGQGATAGTTPIQPSALFGALMRIWSRLNGSVQNCRAFLITHFELAGFHRPMCFRCVGANSLVRCILFTS